MNGEAWRLLWTKLHTLQLVKFSKVGPAYLSGTCLFYSPLRSPKMDARVLLEFRLQLDQYSATSLEKAELWVSISLEGLSYSKSFPANSKGISGAKTVITKWSISPYIRTSRIISSPILSSNIYSWKAYVYSNFNFLSFWENFTFYSSILITK